MALSFFFSTVPSIVCLQAFSVKPKDPLARFRKQYRNDEDQDNTPAAASATSSAVSQRLLFPSVHPPPANPLDRFRNHYNLLPNADTLSVSSGSSST